MIFDEESKKKYSCGSLIKKRSCGGRTIRIESLDVHTTERINRRVSATSKQYAYESHVSQNRGPVKVLIKK